MAVTIADVARKASVSTATASRALRGQPYVAAATRERVLRVARELDYTVLPQALRALTDTKVVGIVVPLVNLWFYSTVSTAASLRLLGEGIETALYRVETPEAQAELVARLVAERLVDACITTTFALPAETGGFAVAQRVPVVTLESPARGLQGYHIDNVAAGELATRHLLNLGHRRVGIITRRQQAPVFATSQARFEGYCRALREAGIAFDDDLVCDGDFVYAGGAEAMQRLLLGRDPPTAVFAVTDEMAAGALRTIRQHHLRVPEEVSVIGFDDNDISEYLGLTTVRQPVTSFGELAAQWLIDRLEGRDPRVEHVRLPHQLVVRATSGPHRAHQAD